MQILTLDNILFVDNIYGMAIKWHVGDVVKKLREAAEMTQKELASLADVRPATISAVEKTGRHDPETLIKFAPFLKSSISNMYALIPGSDSINPASVADAHTFTCSIPEHSSLHRYLERILTEDKHAAGWIEGNLIMFNRALGLLPSGDTPPKRNNVTIAPVRLTDKAAIDPTAKKSRKKFGGK